MKLTTYAFAISSLILSANTKAATVSGDDYECEIIKYESEQSEVKEKLVEPFKVGRDRVTDVIRTGLGAEQLTWRISRTKNLVTVEVGDVHGDVLTTSQVIDGSAVGVKVAFAKAILVCNPESNKDLDADPKALGRRLANDPRAYGEVAVLRDTSDHRLLRTIVRTPQWLAELLLRKHRVTQVPQPILQPVNLANELIPKNGEDEEALKARVIAAVERRLKVDDPNPTFTNRSARVDLINKLKDTEAHNYPSFLSNEEFRKVIMEHVVDLEKQDEVGKSRL